MYLYLMASWWQQSFFSNDSHPAHIRALDGIRGFAVLLVMMSHASLEGLNPAPGIVLMAAGKGGVMLFFVLSAFLLDRQIVQALHQQKATRRYWANYVLRRVLRIYPLFALALVVHWFLDDSWHSPSIDSLSAVGQHLLLQQGTGVFWSIPVEFKYYLISPVLLWGLHRITNWKFPTTSRLLYLLLVLSIVVASVWPWSPISTLKYLPIFLVGTLFSILQYFQPDKLASRFSLPRQTYITVAVLLIAYLILPHPMEHLFGVRVKAHNTVSYSLWALAGLWLVISVQYRKDVFRRIFQVRALRWVGNISFSLYLFHMPVLYAVLNWEGLPSYLRLPTFLLGSFLLASISYLLVERPLSKVRLRKPSSESHIEASPERFKEK